MLRDASPRNQLVPALALLLIAAWVFGGVTVDDTPADEVVQLLALPVLLLSAWVLFQEGVANNLQRMALLSAAGAVLIPLLQLLPLPAAWWDSPPFREGLRHDAVTALSGLPFMQRWTLSPSATEAAFWSILPASAAFLAAMALAQRQVGSAVNLVLILIAGNAVFAFFQVGLPAGSDLRLYQDFDAGFGGFLVNVNHHATALLIGIALSVGQAVHAWRRQQAGAGRAHIWMWYAAFAGACILLMPLTTSRAGVTMAMPVLALALLATGAVRARSILGSKRALAAVVTLSILTAIGMHAALGWMVIDVAEESRHTLALTTMQAGNAAVPWGAGVGTFVPVFEQTRPDLWLGGYANHAHNEYVQWWLEAGYAGIFVLLLVLGVLLSAGWRIARTCGESGSSIIAASCWTATVAVLVHAWVDFPLRTITLATTAAAVTGLLFASTAGMQGRAGTNSPHSS